MNRLDRVLVAALILTLARVPAGAADLAGFLARVRRSAAATASFTCDFRQERRLAMFSSPVVFRGELTVARPRKLAWVVEEPVPSRLVFDGGRGFRCTGGRIHRFDLSSDPVMAQVTRRLWGFVNGSFAELPADWKVSLSADDTVSITPPAGGMFSGIEVAFDSGTMRPRRIKLSQKNGDLTLITLSNYRAASMSAFAGCGGGR